MAKKNIHIDFHNSDRSSSYIAKNTVTKIPTGFVVVPDRHNKVEGSIKVHWVKLNRSFNGVATPHENKGWITRRFNELREQGWKVEKK